MDGGRVGGGGGRYGRAGRDVRGGRGGGARRVAAPAQGRVRGRIRRRCGSRCARGARAGRVSRRSQPAPAPPPLVEGETVGILGVAGGRSSMASAAPSPNCPRRARWSSPSTLLTVGADAADSDDALTRVTVPAKYVARLPPFSLEGISLRCLHDLVDAHATLLGPAATPRDLAERVIAPLTAASGLSLAAARSAAPARETRRSRAPRYRARGRPTLAVAHAAAASLSSLLAALDAHAAAAGLAHESLVLWIDVCSTPLSHDAAPPPGWWSSAALAHGVKAVGSALLVLSPSVPLAMRDGRALFTAVAAIRAGVPLALRMPPAEVPELRRRPRAELSGGARRLCCRRRLSRRRAHRRSSSRRRAAVPCCAGRPSRG